MKAAFIPPRGLEKHMCHSSMVMALAHLTDGLSFYDATVRELAEIGTHVILDNGANEGVSIRDERLAHLAKEIGARELVLPDVLGDSEKTLDAVARYLRYQGTNEMQYMGVVQGTSAPELYKVIDMYATMPLIKTVGLPRLLLGTQLGNPVRIDLANWIRNHYEKRFEIHFLGASSLWLKEPYYAAKYASHVRSIDTSLPYNYGLKGVRIDTTADKIDRSDDYFTTTHKAHALTTVKFNEEVYKEWCRGILSGSVTSVR